MSEKANFLQCFEEMTKQNMTYTISPFFVDQELNDQYELEANAREILTLWKKRLKGL